MSINVVFTCDGCFVKAEGSAPLRKKFVSVLGLSWGFGSYQSVNTIEDVTPEGWIAFDPYTACTYCPSCWASICEAKEEAS